MDLSHIDVSELENILSSGSRQDLEDFAGRNGLVIKDNKLYARDHAAVEEAIRYWDKRQLVTKISLNSLYGAILNSGCRFFDKRIGQSTTLTGRRIARHMAAKTNELLTGKYDHTGECIIYGDTDSVAAESIIHTSDGDMRVEELFNLGTTFWNEGDKEYSANKSVSIAHSNDGKDIDYVNYNYVYRHKVSKPKFTIKTSSGKSVTVTGDHSIMVLLDGVLVEKNPSQLSIGDAVVCIVKNNTDISSIVQIEQLDDFNDEYVYDIGVATGDPYFFANDILVHNSVYFTAVPALPEGHTLDLESAVKLYDHISNTVSDTFPDFLKTDCNVPHSNGKVMQAGREVVGRAGLFITKKRYAIQCLDIEGYQPEGGKLKIMGLDVKRSDTPEFVQDFLEEILRDCLSGSTEPEVLEKIKQYKKHFKSLDPWKKGMPKRVNNLTYYTAIAMSQASIPDNFKLHKLKALKEEQNNSTIPGHVRASINWNNFKKAMGDNYSMTITDGAKVVVCRLRTNTMGYDSIAYPTDELQLPDWFKQLPFDEAGMEEAVLDKKITNVIGQMGFDLARINESESISNFFDFG
jgi:hypothetical protein